MSNDGTPYPPSGQGGQPSYGSGPSQPYGSGPGQNPPGPPQGSPYGAPQGSPYGAPQGAGAPQGSPYGAPQGSPYGSPQGSPYGAPQGGSPYGAPQPGGSGGFGQSNVAVVPGGPQATGPDGEPLLSQPLYGATFMQALKRFFKKYARFSGYASLSEYWWSALALALISIVLTIPLIIGAIVLAASVSADPYGETGVAVSGGAGGGVLMVIGYALPLLFSLAILIPSLAISARRLHDGGFSALFLFLYLIPSVGALIVLVFMFLPTKPEARRPEWDDTRGD